MKLKVNTIDFEALIKDLPIVNPLKVVYETSYIIDYHYANLRDEYKKQVKRS